MRPPTPQTLLSVIRGGRINDVALRRGSAKLAELIIRCPTSPVFSFSIKYLNGLPNHLKNDQQMFYECSHKFNDNKQQINSKLFLIDES